MVKKYLIFDRFDFLCRFFSRFFYNDFFLVVRNLRVLHRISPYEEQLFAIKVYVESTNLYLDLMNTDFEKNIVIAVFPGGEKYLS